jgi:hypothetical protein
VFDLAPHPTYPTYPTYLPYPTYPTYSTYQTYLPYQAFVLDAHIAATHAGEVQARW